MPGLKLTPDQEKLWPPVESRGAGFRQDADRSRQCADECARRMHQQATQQKPDDPVARLRERADNMAATAAALKSIADAADPLYKTLDDGQKRRLAMLTHRGTPACGGEGWRHRGFERGMAWAATGIVATTAMAGRDRDHGGRGGPSGSSRANSISDRNAESRRNSGGFSRSRAAPIGRE